MKHYYILFVEGDTEPEVLGPYPNDAHRDAEAKMLRQRHGPAHGIFALELDTERPVYLDQIQIWAYSAKFFEEE